MLQHTVMVVVGQSNQCRISYTISDIGYLNNYSKSDIQYFLKIVQYESDANTYMNYMAISLWISIERKAKLDIGV